MWELDYATLGWALSVVLLTLLARFFSRLYFWRTLCHDLPGPPHHWLWGHLVVMGKVLSTQPSRAAPQSIVIALQRAYDLPDYFYLDPWPFGPSMMVTTHPDLSNQFTLKPSLPKHKTVADFTQAFGGRENMVASDGPEWKTWRSAFNPGFSLSHLMTLMPAIVDDVSIFCNLIARKAEENRPFRLEPLATHLTVDVIGKIVLDTRLNSQLSKNELVSAFESQVRWIPTGALAISEFINVLRPFVLAYNNWRMDRYVAKELENRFASRKQRGSTKHVIDLALETYLKESNKTKSDSNGVLDKVFKRKAIDNVKIFLFAGHDTSSSVICYCFYYLGRNPSSMNLVRKEIETIFGSDPDSDSIGQLIKDDPWLLNKMEYSLAVIREVLRLQSPASTVRLGAKGYFIIDPETNERLPTEHLLLWASNMGLLRNTKVWGEDVDTFRPERWLEATSSASGAGIRDANVAFSKGPRNCIGQELALLEVKMVLAMTIRRFDFTAAFDELDQLRNDGSGYPSDTSGIQEQFGEQAYQIQLGTAKPREGLPCRVTLVK